MTAEKQLDLFGWGDESQAPPQKPKKPKKKLKTGEVAYQCLDCDEKPTIYDRIKPMIKCSQCGMYLEVIDEKIPMIGEN